MSAKTSNWQLILISITLVMSAFMVVVDMTIANVALPHMMGSLGATSEQITWVLTSYTIAEAIFIPLTGYFSRFLGERSLLLLAVTGFIVFSALCGQADSLTSMIVYRICQGAMGASIIPLTQSLMVRYFPDDKKDLAMALWGIGIMMGPVFGPTIGGLITTHTDWRWIFYVNIPVGLIALLLIYSLIGQTQRSKPNIDWLMVAFMAIGIGSLQAFLDQGNSKNWLDSGLIRLLLLSAIIGFSVFIYRAWNDPDSIVPLRLFKDRNLMMSSLLMAVMSIAIFGSIVIQPLLMEGILGYPPDTAGFIMMPRGIANATGMLLAVALAHVINPRAIIVAGITLSALGCMLFFNLTLMVDPINLIVPGIIQGLGFGLIFVPLSSLAYATLANDQATNAAALFNLSRTIGSSMGISLVSTVLTRSTQTQWQELGSNINPYNPQVNEWLGHLNMTIDSDQAASMLAQLLAQQSTMLGFINAYFFVFCSIVCVLPLLLFIRHNSQ
ncbi:DHA2 family efflux MFS transporter permease subunit [Thalassotalea litorea]|uniref:DHA2 family efflux MFS transporter permease subunit n=1 Tax=Thalassotalea litorea TaxID=2020715 RepID=UPI003736212C